MNWIVMIVSWICTTASFYLVYMSLKAGEGIPWIFIGFGVLFGIPFVISIVKVMAGKGGVFKKIDERFFKKPEPQVTFVPHSFMMTAIIITGLVIIVSIAVGIIRTIR